MPGIRIPRGWKKRTLLALAGIFVIWFVAYLAGAPVTPGRFIGYVATSKLLKEAREAAEQGNIIIMVASLTGANYAAKKAGRDVTEDVAEIKKLGYSNSVIGKISKAFDDIKNGKYDKAKELIQLAKQEAKEHEIDISDKLAEIRNWILTKGPSKLEAAKSFLKKFQKDAQADSSGLASKIDKVKTILEILTEH